MYNEELKNEFLQWNDSNVEQKRGLFEHIANFEQVCNKDVSDMGVEEYHQCLKASGEAFMNGFIELYRVLESYGKWVVTEKRRPVLWVESCTMYEAYLADACFPKVWLWPDIAAELLSLYPITEGHEIWPIAVLGWLGLTQRECCALRNEDVDLKKRQIRIGDRVIAIQTADQWKVLAAYANTTEGLRTQNRTFTVSLVDLGFFLKGTRTKNSRKELKPFTLQQLQARFAQYGNKCRELHRVPQFGFFEISRMGSYHQLWIRQTQQGENLEEMSTRDIQSIFHVKGTTPTRKMLLTEYQLYLKKLEERNTT